ncbi:putative hemin transport protein [Pedobacter cryoconitis]|uniref:hemin-degrading factor n=1 Tax=Pedobacter cryoconitis TaxID=188932 RepID=UPI0016175E49|nr:ChuX/HutX family heme-like substrate-binding protein [Pedobacter cryoconitis]MBB6272006.1 putative hemin transport protein [Pedobacter cryoconitis]
MEKVIELKSQWEAFKTENPKVRIRDAAKQLDTTEAELLATAVGETVIRLTNDFQDILKGVGALGKVMALTRNDYCVHERKGVYKNVTFSGPMGLVVNPDIDLRLFMMQWSSAFAVDENTRKSLQFFGKDGEAIHKIYLVETSDVQAYDALVNAFTAHDQHAVLVINRNKKVIEEKPDAEIDAAGFKETWLTLKDTHDFHGMLRKFGVTRTQGLRLAPEGHAVSITKESLKSILEKASETDLEIMVFTGSAGCIQIHTGPVKKLLQTGPWFNVLDPDFNMHLREDAIASVWLVKKPTTDGIVTSIEVFDKYGDIIVQFFGKRKPGIPENEHWRLMVNEIAIIAS